jgi:hypothetical protein
MKTNELDQEQMSSPVKSKSGGKAADAAAGDDDAMGLRRLRHAYYIAYFVVRRPCASVDYLLPPLPWAGRHLLIWTKQ